MITNLDNRGGCIYAEIGNINKTTMLHNVRQFPNLNNITCMQMQTMKQRIIES